MFRWGSKVPSPAQQHIGGVLFNDGMHVLSSFELNRIASLTYGDEVCDDIFEILEQVQSRPMEHSVLTVQKSLVITKHIMIYGSEKCVNSTLSLQRGVEGLLEFNTVLWAQQLQGAAAMMHRLKGGGVDKGYPVREAAKEVWPLMMDLNKLRELRNNSADPNSLVPIGNSKVAFLSDEVRHYMLKKRIQEQYNLQTKSNLVKAQGGFGSGYASKDGKMVVGAAHGLEEMVKQAEIANRKFSDTGNVEKYDVPDLNEIMAMPKGGRTPNNVPATASTNFDLLGGGEVGPVNVDPQKGPTVFGDLLDFSSGPTQPQAGNTCFGRDPLEAGASASSGSADLFGTASFGGTGDLLGTGMSALTLENTSNLLDPHPTATKSLASNGLLDLASPLVSTGQHFTSSDLLDFGAAPVPTGKQEATVALAEPMSLLSMSEQTATLGGNDLSGLGGADPLLRAPRTTEEAPKSKVIGRSLVGGSILNPSNEDRFAALDSLEVPAARIASRNMSAKEAESRLLGQTSLPVLSLSSSKDIKLTSCDKSEAEREPASEHFNSTTDDNLENLSSAAISCKGYSVMQTTVPAGAPEAEDVGIAMPSSTPPTASGRLADFNVSLGMPTQGIETTLDPGEFATLTSPGSSLKIASLNLSSQYGDGPLEDDDDGFLMGGSMGSGLVPTTSAPAAPPPPPPSM